MKEGRNCRAQIETVEDDTDTRATPGGKAANTEEDEMKRFMIAVAVSAFAVSAAIGPAAGQGAPVPGTCEAKAVTKDGKPLAGAARTSFLTKCKRDMCAPKAVDSNGKALKGAAKNSFMAKCEREQA
jgi:hypothetical protein